MDLKEKITFEEIQGKQFKVKLVESSYKGKAKLAY
jgi:hypothetical protein